MYRFFGAPCTIWKSGGHAFGKYITSCGPWTLCDGPETPTQWKSESVSAGRINQLTGVGSRDASKKLI